MSATVLNGLIFSDFSGICEPAFWCECAFLERFAPPVLTDVLFVFCDPLMWRLISSARDSEIFCLTSFQISIILQRNGTGATLRNETRIVSFVTESRSGSMERNNAFVREIREPEKLQRNELQGWEFFYGSAENVKFVVTFMKDGEYRKGRDLFYEMKACRCKGISKGSLDNKG